MDNPKTSRADCAESKGRDMTKEDQGPYSGDDDDGDNEDSSSSNDLESFRKQWEKELKAKKQQENAAGAAGAGGFLNSKLNVKTRQQEDQDQQELEERAKEYFLKGIQLERNNLLYDAVKFYRRAIQIDPDIEYKVNSEESAAASSVDGSALEDEDKIGDLDEDVDDKLDEDTGPLDRKFLKTFETNGWQFFEMKKKDSKTNISFLPIEILTYILRWVVSNELDLRSLDVVSEVCRGFYCLSRDENLWKMACERVWGPSKFIDSYSSYRDMFLKRTRVSFDGCYISKVSYIRAGEHSFQDTSSRLWHLVEYYRYVRFFTDGTIYFLTSPDNPKTQVSLLKDRQQPRNPSCLRGRYRIYGNNGEMVNAIVKCNTSPSELRNRSNKEGGNKRESYFHLEFQIKEVKNKTNCCLNWTNYGLYSKSISNRNDHQMQMNELHGDSDDMLTTFDLNPTKFPPLYFSRVKSYTQKSESILE